MPKRIFLVLLLLLASHAAVKAQEPAKKNSYEALLERVKKQDATVNFAEFRMAFTETSQYHPYAGDSADRKAMFAALNAKEYEKALAASTKILDENYVDMNGHFGALAAHRNLGHGKEFEFHRFVFSGLLDSLEKSGDGKSPKTAYVVISVDEEYVWFNVKGLRVEDQAKIDDQGHSYDRMTATNSQTGDKITVYFNIDKPFNWLANTLKEPDKPKKQD
jgi:hypothetical protein